MPYRFLDVREVKSEDFKVIWKTKRGQIKIFVRVLLSFTKCMLSAC